MRPAFFDDDEEEDDGGDNRMEADQPNNNNTVTAASRFSSTVDNQNSDEKTKQEEGEEEEEDDYMTMTFAENTSSQPETSLQRRQRLQREGLRRGMVPSKAQLAEQERERREQGLSRSLFAPTAGADEGILLGEKIAAERRRKAEQAQQDAAWKSSSAAATKNTKSKGLAMMAKMGFTPGSTLGRREREEHGEAMVEPLRIHVREDRGGIGLGDERKRKLREALLPLAPQQQQEENENGNSNDPPAERQNKKTKIVDEGDYRERMAKEQEVARKEKLVHAAQKIAERMDQDKRGAVNSSSSSGGGSGVGGTAPRPLKAVPVLYRGLVRHREEAERDRRARHDLEQSSGFADAVVKLPSYAEDEDDLDAYDRMALGKGGKEEEGALLQPSDPGLVGNDEKKKKKPVYMPADDLDEQDDELDTFKALEVDERLAQLVKYLREEFRYCFWCKFVYPNEAMEGCPGITEEDHD